ncbi:MAG: recombination protein RecT [Desulfotomaculales bacterium]
MSSGNGLKDKLAQKAAETGKGTSIEATIYNHLKKMEPEIRKALPRHMDADRLARIAFTVIRTNPKLLQCTLPSLLGAVMQAAQLGLEPGILGHCYFVPFWNDKIKQYEVQFIVGYRGMIDLARRSGEVQSVVVHEVYENDYLEVQYGLEEKLVHVPWHLRKDEKFEDGGEIRGFYMVARFKDGGYHFHYMPKAEIDSHRKRSKAAENGPWVTDYTEMGKKTVVRSAWKWLPISVEIMRNLEASDETVKHGPEELEPVTINAEAYVQPESTGEGETAQTQDEPSPPQAEEAQRVAEVPLEPEKTKRAAQQAKQTIPPSQQQRMKHIDQQAAQASFF